MPSTVLYAVQDNFFKNLFWTRVSLSLFLTLRKYLSLLEAVGSDSPEALLKPLGVDIHDPRFWQKGFDEIRSLVKRLEGLVDKA